MKLFAIESMKQAWYTLEGSAPQATGSKATAAKRAAFHEGVVLLFAGELARRAGDVAAAKALGVSAGAVGALTGASQIDKLRLDGQLGPRIKEALAKLPGVDKLTATADGWRLQGWEPDPL